MSMAGLLAKFGHDAGRWVSADGRVSIAPASTGSSGYSIRPHTFHGGEDPVDSSRPSSSRQRWWADESAMEAERAVMASAFPGFEEVPGDEQNPPAWYGVLDSGRGKFPVFLVHRWDHELPAVVPVQLTRRGKAKGKGWVKAPHLYLSGNLCVADVSDWNASQNTMADVVAWAAHWHACYVEWLSTDKWPSEGVLDAAA